jgi:hypothetical protein
MALEALTLDFPTTKLKDRLEFLPASADTVAGSGCVMLMGVGARKRTLSEHALGILRTSKLA